MAVTKILIVDDHQIVREGFQLLLARQKGFEVVGQAEDGREAIRLVKVLSPDVVVMDISMPDIDGIKATSRILKKHPHVKIVTLSMHSDKRFVIPALKAGAAGYVVKGAAFDELALAINTVVSGQSYLSPAITDVVVKDYLQDPPSSGNAVLSVLTQREREVFISLAEGKNVKEIALDFSLSVKTIETHRGHVMKKLGFRSIADLTRCAVYEGLVASDM